MKTTMIINGTHCNSCKMLIEETCLEFPGVESCIVDLKTGRTVVDHEEKIDLKKLKKEIEKLGDYKVVF